LKKYNIYSFSNSALSSDSNDLISRISHEFYLTTMFINSGSSSKHECCWWVKWTQQKFYTHNIERSQIIYIIESIQYYAWKNLHQLMPKGFWLCKFHVFKLPHFNILSHIIRFRFCIFNIWIKWIMNFSVLFNFPFKFQWQRREKGSKSDKKKIHETSCYFNFTCNLI
jgi:hypothetical protein